MSLVLNNPQNIPHFSLGLSDSRETDSGGRSGGEGGRVWGLGRGGGEGGGGEREGGGGREVKEAEREEGEGGRKRERDEGR